MRDASLWPYAAISLSPPPLTQVAMMAEVAAMMRKRQYHEAMIDCGMLTSLAQVEPMPRAFFPATTSTSP